MRLTLLAVGRMKDGPERDLVARYVKRAADSGRALGFGALSVLEIPEAKAARAEERRAREAAAIREAAGLSVLVCLDERGESLPSEKIAAWLAKRRDAGAKAMALVIGGADGLAPELRADAAAVWCFGAATFPHQIVRILAAEQLYRAMTILSGHPYHRGE